ncbi:MAG TPA: transporter substrate-binding domain-containing protein, partial [Clostridia bacterium]|nr:transporter substrate-binding domain-containing protein [Clostridia bacterium]
EEHKMKKIIALLLAAMLLLSATACGSASSSAAPSASAAPSSSTAPASSESAGSAIKSVADLTGKKIGVQLGTTGDIYASEIEGATIEQYNKAFEAVQALSQGKIDAVIIDDQVAKALSENNSAVVVLDEPFTVEEYAMCLSKDKSDLTAAMNTAIAQLKADGTLQAILDKYIGQVEGAKGYETPANADHSKGTLVMATNAEFPPYEYREGDSVVGVDAEFAKAICDKLGYELKIEDMAFDAIIAAVQSGKADFGAAGMTITEERLMSIDFTDSYCTASQVVIIKK